MSRHRGSSAGGGTEVSGYRLLGEIGRGGFSAVMLAEDLAAGRRVALKVARGRDAQTLARFAVEARVGSRLASARGIVGVLAETRTRDGRPVLVLPYYDLGSAGSLLAEGERLPLAGVVQLVRQVAQGLAAMHGQQILHRDVSPRNILRSSELGAGLGDLGCARAVNSVEQSPWTEALTPGYGAPEAGVQDAVQTVVSDVYGLAATTWALSTGEPPYGDPPDRAAVDLLARYDLRRWQARPPVERLLAAGVPPPVGTVLAGALDPDPSRRPASVREFSDALAAATEHGLIDQSTVDRPAAAAVSPLQPPEFAARPADPTQLAGGAPARRVRARRRRWVPLVVAAACFLVAYGVVSLLSGSEDEQKPPASTLAPSTPATEKPAGPPRDLRITADAGGRIDLAWTAPSDPDVVVVLYRSVGGAGWAPVGPGVGGRATVPRVGTGRYCFRLAVVIGAKPGGTGEPVCTG